MPTTTERRHHYQTFTAQVHQLCTDPGVRRTLRDGRGRPVKDCLDLHRYLTRRTAGHGARRAHYTVAALIALADPPDPRPAGEHHQAEEQNQEEHHQHAHHCADTAPHHPEPAPPHPESHAPDRLDDRTPPARPSTGPAEENPYQGAAWHQRPNLGTTLATAVQAADYNPARTEEMLRVLVHLGDDQLHRRLPSLVKRLLDNGLTPDWTVLLDDLAQRPYDRNPVGTRWLDAFYLHPAHHTPGLT
ncbi:type I-E CRISPR-associated protein Cse2/CasB [Streptomyces sp. UNOC14_S4]|uniref:type I-E CRISPR-associated protein Cse2/CasB n=1 Tax=Streptomyces sp. UNOC14_S4 TaxID=2872340 RepID=UPI001E585228|nr:type I-E CRISPR-associated protein Cse2/CasB [Streptomyces sp. UNOC14_S4]MCC3772754.1 type I-E CRISPR-associated protein Cse2/CasB [Streptomyces sp. UNOC14_S4]